MCSLQSASWISGVRRRSGLEHWLGRRHIGHFLVHERDVTLRVSALGELHEAIRFGVLLGQFHRERTDDGIGRVGRILQEVLDVLAMPLGRGHHAPYHGWYRY